MNKHCIYGFHAVEALLHQGKTVQRLYVQSGKQDQRLQILLQYIKERALNIPIDIVSRQELDRLAQHQSHQGIVAICNEHPALFTHVEDLLVSLTEPAFLLILDGVQDPHNLGACLRTANAAGVHAVIAPKDRATGITPVVRKVACGAAEITPFIPVTNLVRTMRMLKDNGIWLFGAAETGTENIFTTDLTGPIALVLGAEGEGLRRLTVETCDKLIKIPTIGAISSLNVSVATGICLFEALRQRGGV